MGRGINEACFLLFHVFRPLVHWSRRPFLSFRGCIVATPPVRHQSPHGANSWVAINEAVKASLSLEVREALRVDNLVANKGLAQSAAFFSVDNLYNISLLCVLPLFVKNAGILCLWDLSPIKFDWSVMDRLKSCLVEDRQSCIHAHILFPDKIPGWNV